MFAFVLDANEVQQCACIKVNALLELLIIAQLLNNVVKIEKQANLLGVAEMKSAKLPNWSKMVYN